jgi:preprotein translocase subunit SecG
MFLAISILIFIVCIFLILIVLVQNSKGGGLTAGFSASNQVMGVRKTTDFLEKATWSLAGTIVVLSIVSAAFLNTSDAAVAKQSIIKDEVQNAVQVDPNLNASPDFQNQAGNPAATNKAGSAPAPTQEAPVAKK